MTVNCSMLSLCQITNGDEFQSSVSFEVFTSYMVCSNHSDEFMEDIGSMTIKSTYLTL